MTKVHTADCAFTKAQDSGACDCGIGDDDYAGNTTAHTDNSCNYVAADPDHESDVTWATGASAYAAAQTASFEMPVKVDFTTDSTNLDIDGLGDLTGIMKITFQTGCGGGGGTSSYTVTYDAGANGKITSGSRTEPVDSGKNPAKVPTVTANDGYVFVGWSLDGKSIVKPEEQKIEKSLTFTAVYAPLPILEKDDHMGYINGYPDQTFRPSNQITRAEVAAMFYRVTKNASAYEDIAPASFTDVAGSEWYATAVLTMQKAGVIDGYTDCSFRPNAPITREEFAAIAARFGKVIEGTEMPFTDVADRWSTDYIFTAYTNGWINGYEDGTYRPTANITRAESVKIINSMLERSITAESIADATYATFSDVADGHWARSKERRHRNVRRGIIGKQPRRLQWTEAQLFL